MERDLTRERGLWGPPDGSTLDKWTLDLVEGKQRVMVIYLHKILQNKLQRRLLRLSIFTLMPERGPIVRTRAIITMCQV
jgi:hypothetical protein